MTPPTFPMEPLYKIDNKIPESGAHKVSSNSPKKELNKITFLTNPEQFQEINCVVCFEN